MWTGCCAPASTSVWATTASPTPCGRSGKPPTWPTNFGIKIHAGCPAILFGFEPSAVTTTIAAGQVLMKDRQLLFLDEAEITAKSRELAAQTWQRYNALF